MAQAPYNRLRDARSEARDAEKMLDAGNPDARDPLPFWRTVRDLGLKTITEAAKDLEVAAWVTEAYVRSHGLPGLTAGAKLIAGLAERYWDNVYPLPDEYGVETRVAPVTGLNGRDGNGSLIQPLHKLTLFTRPDGTPIALYQFQASEQLATLDAARKKQRIEAGTIPIEDLEKEARIQGPHAVAKLRTEAREALEAWETMATLLDEKASEAPPSTSQVRDLVRLIYEIANRYAPPEAAPAPVEAEGNGADGGAVVATGGTGVTMPNVAVAQAAVVTREDALRALENIAAYFRKNEPLSPLAYTLDEAIRRSRMTWPDFLQEIVADPKSRADILNSLGIRPPPPPAAG